MKFVNKDALKSTEGERVYVLDKIRLENKFFEHWLLLLILQYMQGIGPYLGGGGGGGGKNSMIIVPTTNNFSGQAQSTTSKYLVSLRQSLTHMISSHSNIKAKYP